MTIIDANGLILGRLASDVAKRLLAGDKIDIVNAEKAVISGSKLDTIAEYRNKISIGSTEFGPHFPKRPERILKRTVRGMLPYRRSRGRDAMARLKVHVGVPLDLKDKEMIQVAEASMKRLSSNKYMRLGDVSTKMGGKF
ncbi:ribosomal protein L13, archaeal/eukaryotic [Methanomethylovorans hollandica DSM 15978]|jgi:large subunit ribosomal protein L13|uniref:Large ribosomal subunit protein uL13 n=1 Tax=Methanomethylovorans hollandica (strain DSM 15978 / NBRC 107637 / DMS1) TaxID=867904 RepID=L0KYT8_METHD|nr:50S ribosomal protein L13 [Methanomethylovorans hollandica]AGB49835.1 ribosomal protein L13, archaeal/eukaryotic [Methanomethylovorans hollandica DSM 15978]